MSNIVKNQHYLPKFYLKGFCDQESKITIFDRERGEIRFNQNPQKYAVERYFYDTDSKELKKLFEKWVILYPKLCNIINIDDKQFIEHFFNRLETVIAKLFETILNDPDVLYDQKNQSQKKSLEEEITLCNKMRFIPITLYDSNDNMTNDGIGLVSVLGGGS